MGRALTSTSGGVPGERADRRPSAWRVVLTPPVLVPAGVAVVLALLGRVPAALLALVVALLLGQAFALSPGFRAGFHRAVATLVAGVGHVLTVVLLAPLFVLVFAPIGLWQRLRRRPLAPHGPREARGAWVGGPQRHVVGMERRPFDRRPRPSRGFASAVGVLAVVVVADLLLGALLTATGAFDTDDSAEVARQRARIEEMITSPAMRDEPWARTYADDLLDGGTRSNPEYVPYRVWGQVPFDGELINVTEEGRVSYQQADVGDGEPLRIAFFGGSTMFGEGQRDEHTIPSEVARLAEQQGVPVEVHNYGVSGWVAWQEYLHLEELLGRGEQYDLVVFYDGINEQSVQSFAYDERHTHFGVDQLQALAEQRDEQEVAEPTVAGRASALFEAYRDSSGVAILWEGLTGEEVGAPEASPATGPQVPPEQVDATVVDLYGRSVAAVSDLAAQHDVPVLFFWQPQEEGWSATVRSGLPAEVTDLSEAFDAVDEPVYLDGFHTNELGAEIIAAEIWRGIEATLGGAEAPTSR